MPERRVLIFSSLLLPPSETFVRAQGEGLRRFKAHYVGSRFVPGLNLPPDRTTVANDGSAFGAAKEAMFKLMGTAPGLLAKLRRSEPELLHAHFGIGGALALPLARRLKLPMVVTFHGADVTVKDEFVRKSGYSDRIYLRRREWLRQEPKALIAVSQFIRGKMLEQGFPAEKIVVHYIGVDTEFFRADPQLPREPMVLFVGRLAEKKGCEYLVRAMARVQASMPEVKLKIIGDGPLRPSLERLAGEVLRNYEFTGFVTPEVVKEQMNRAWLYAAPSLTAHTGEQEGCPMVVVEAQSMGTPVVGTRSAGIPEAVLHGTSGLLYPERDAEGLAHGMLMLLRDRTLRERFAVAGRARMQAEFDLLKQTSKLEDLYEEVICSTERVRASASNRCPEEIASAMS